MKWLGLSILMLITMAVCVYLIFSDSNTVENFPNNAPLYIGLDDARQLDTKKDHA